MKQKIIEFLKNSNIKFKTKDDMVLFFAGRFTKTPKEIKIVIEQMLTRGEIYEKKKGQFCVAGADLIKGKIIGNKNGYAFLSPVDKTRPDFFIAPKKLNGALNGDTVLAKILMETAEITEAEVISVLENANETVVGTITYINKKSAFVVPDNKKLAKEIFIPQSFTKNAKSGYRVVVKLGKGREKQLTGQVVEILGESDDIKSLELGIIREHKLYEEFPTKVLCEVEKIPQRVQLSEYENRVDLRNKKIFTIDGEDARDFDDAVSIEKFGKDYILSVHIADVGNYVKYNSELDKEAYTRGTSVYFPNMVLPMLPKELSNGICSLNEKVDRLTLTCDMVVDKDGNIKDHKIYESVICSCHRLTYTQVYDVLCGKEDKSIEDIKEDLFLMNELSKILEKRRFDAGELDLDIPETQVCVDEDLNVTFLEKRDRNEAHRLIENFMVICNEVVARHFKLKGVPFVYRIHEKPVLDKVKGVCAFLNNLGLPTDEITDISPKYVQDLIERTKNEEYGEVAHKVILRSLQKAKYLNEPLGHFGLALEDYCHFTSPIRRYPDLCIHRIIKESLTKTITKNRKFELEDFVLDASYRSSDTEKNADEAERAVDDLFKAVYIKGHVGEEFEGIISGVQNYGIYVELENTVEGLVKIENLPADTYIFMEKSLMLKGNSHIYKLGDKVKIKVINSNVFDRKIDFIIEKNWILTPK